MSTLEFNHLVTVHSSHLKGFAIHFTKNTEDAEDLIQDTLYKALRYKDHFQDGTNFKGWLYTIMRNIFINGYKRKKLQQQVSQAAQQDFIMNSIPSEDAVNGGMDYQEMTKSIANLPQEYKKPFQMYLDGYHYDEIAQNMEIPIGTVKSRIFHARQKLMQTLKDFR
jgi:RNA polymerase sigma-70 factor (ECF subfamily)